MLSYLRGIGPSVIANFANKATIIKRMNGKVMSYHVALNITVIVTRSFGTAYILS